MANARDGANRITTDEAKRMMAAAHIAAVGSLSGKGDPAFSIDTPLFPNPDTAPSTFVPIDGMPRDAATELGMRILTRIRDKNSPFAIIVNTNTGIRELDMLNKTAGPNTVYALRDNRVVRWSPDDSKS